MVGDDGHRSVRCKAIAQRRKRTLEDTEFVVDRDAERLEKRREPGRSAAWTQHGANRADQVIADAEWTVLAATDNLARESSRPRLVGVFAKDPDELVFVAFVEQSRRIDFRLGTHAHIQWCTGPEREATFFFVDLVRRDTEIEKNPVPRFSVEVRVFVDLGEVGANGTEGTVAPIWLERARRGFEGGGILIDACDAGTPVKERERVPASSERAVQNVPSVAEQLGDLASENRRVKGWVSSCLGHRTAST